MIRYTRYVGLRTQHQVDHHPTSQNLQKVWRVLSEAWSQGPDAQEKKWKLVVHDGVRPVKTGEYNIADYSVLVTEARKRL